MLDKVKTDLRIAHSLLDDDIQSNIDACLLDLSIAGVENTDIDDALITKAVCLYCRWQYDYAGKGDRYEKAYVSLKAALSLSGDYNVQ